LLPGVAGLLDFPTTGNYGVRMVPSHLIPSGAAALGAGSALADLAAVVSCPASASGFERPSNASNRRISTANRPDLPLFAADLCRSASVCLQNPGFCRKTDAPVPVVAPNSPRFRAA
jgi:hypothetical protein